MLKLLSASGESALRQRVRGVGGISAGKAPLPPMPAPLPRQCRRRTSVPAAPASASAGVSVGSAGISFWTYVGGRRRGGPLPAAARAAARCRLRDRATAAPPAGLLLPRAPHPPAAAARHAARLRIGRGDAERDTRHQGPASRPGLKARPKANEEGAPEPDNSVKGPNQRPRINGSTPPPKAAPGILEQAPRPASARRLCVSRTRRQPSEPPCGHDRSLSPDSEPLP